MPDHSNKTTFDKKKINPVPRPRPKPTPLPVPTVRDGLDKSSRPK